MADPRSLLPPGFQIVEDAAPDPMASLPAGFQVIEEGKSAPVVERRRTGFAGQVRDAFEGTNAPAKVQARPVGDIARDYGEIGIGLAEGVPAGVIGMPGDIESIARAGLSRIAPVSPETIMPTSESAGQGINAFVGLGDSDNPMRAAGRTAGSFIGPGAAGKVVRAAAKSVRPFAGAGATEAAQAAHEAGFALPPGMASERPGLVSQGLSALSGKVKLAQAASSKNEQVATSLAAKSVGLPDDMTITEEALESVRREAGKAYEAVKRAPVEIIPDDTYSTSLAAIHDIGAEARAEIPELVNNSEIDNLVSALSGKEKLSPAAAVDLVKSLRYKAHTNLKNYTSPEKMDLGRAQSKAASAIEALIDRNLDAATTARAPIGATGGDMTALVAALRDARETIAKTYDVESALNPATGLVDGRKIAALAAKGKPLTGDLKRIAEAAGAFPKAFQRSSQFGGEEKLSVMDLGAAALSGGASIPLSLARPGARSFVLSPGYQNMLMSQGGASGAANALLSRVPPVNPFALQGQGENRLRVPAR